MEEKTEFNDILIDSKEHDQNRNKKMIFLLAAAGLLFVILVIAIIAGLANGESEQEKTEKNVALQGSLKPQTEEASLQDVGNRFEPVKTQDSLENDRFEEIVRQIQERANTQNSGAPSSTSNTKPQILPTPELQDQSHKTQLPQRESSQTPPQKTTQDTKPSQNTQQPQASKSANTQAAQKSVSQQKPSATGSDRSKNGQSATKGHYIQVGSFGNTPNKEFLGKINNYSYRTYKTKNSTKYLIGPYNSRTDANRDMLKVKTDMGDEVFYYEVK